MTLTAPDCGMGGIIAHDAKCRIENVPGVKEADVEVVFDPPWNQQMMSEAAKLELGLLWADTEPVPSLERARGPSQGSPTSALEPD